MIGSEVINVEARLTSNTLRKRALWCIAPLIAVTAAVTVFISTRSGLPVAENDLSYTQIVRICDAERRQEPLGAEMADELVDMTAFAGMPDAYSKGVLQYVEKTASALKTDPFTRGRFYHEPRKNDIGPYPDDANPVYDTDVVVPLVILPRPEIVQSWSESPHARELGWRTEQDTIGNRGSAYGRTVIFEPGKRSLSPTSWPVGPFGATIPSWDAYVPEYDSKHFLILGKVVVAPSYDYRKGGVLEDRTPPPFALARRMAGNCLQRSSPFRLI